MSSSSLKSFIKAVRNSKTIATERATIRKESAKIRTAFRDIHLDDRSRRVNISKLLYLYILGEPTYFGQVECLKLLASPTFTSKRLGYLATMLILDENQEVLTLLTNSLDNDIKSQNQYIAGLALVTLGNIASPELARDLYTNVENILTSGNVYLRKKAAIVAAKLIDKDPDLSEFFLPIIPNLLNEKSHGVVLGALHLIRSIYSNDENSHEPLKLQIPRLLSHLKLLSTTGYSPEYDVKGVPDPFLYVSLLHTLRLLLANDDTNSNLEPLNDLLTQVCSNIKSNAYSVLYETVQTIFMINSDSSLKVLGINILSEFLTHKDNNTRYVALNTLLNVINYEPLAVQRHRATVIGCLKDGDISIRRRALELTFAIINAQNIRVLAKELLNFLSNSDDELKPYITTQLSIACNKYSPNLKWHFETLISMLKLVGNYFSNDILSSILALVMQNSDIELTKYLVTELVKSSRLAYNQFGFALVTAWCIGEYGDLILGTTYENSSLRKTETITEVTLVQLIETFINISTFDESNQTNQIKIYCLTSALKLSSKFKESRNIESLRKIINGFKNDYNLEIQIRAIEYSEIFGQPMSVKKGLLERMPAPPFKMHEGISLVSRTSITGTKPNRTATSSATGDLLLDLLGDDESNGSLTINNISNGNAQRPIVKKETTMDLLSDIFGSSNNSISRVPTSTNNNKNSDIMNLFGSATTATTTKSRVAPPTIGNATVSPTAVPIVTANPSIEAFNDSNISISFATKEIGNGLAVLEARATNTNTSGKAIRNINILCAVTKQQKLQLSPISKNSLNPKEFANLNVKISGNEGSKIKIRVKVGYEMDGENISKQFDFAGIKQPL